MIKIWNFILYHIISRHRYLKNFPNLIIKYEYVDVMLTFQGLDPHVLKANDTVKGNVSNQILDWEW